MKGVLQGFIESESTKEFSIPMIPVRTIEKLLIELGYDQLEMQGEETNGWQIDFWYYFKGTDKTTICMTGSLHYGNFKLSKE